MDGEDRETGELTELLERLARTGPADGDKDEDAELGQAVALLAMSLEPAVPRPEARARLLASLPPRQPVPRLPAAQSPSQPATGTPLAEVVELARHRERRALSAVRFLVAALLACGIGIAYLLGRSGAPAGNADSSHQAAQLAAQLEAQRVELEKVQKRLAMVTTVARYAYRMQSVGVTPARNPADLPQGMVYVCGHHQQWILSLEHLPPPPPGREYHVRFHTATGEVDGGVLRVGQDARAEKEDVQLPPGTRGFSVTLQPAQGAPGDPLLVLQSSSGVAL